MAYLRYKIKVLKKKEKRKKNDNYYEKNVGSFKICILTHTDKQILYYNKMKKNINNNSNECILNDTQKESRRLWISLFFLFLINN